VSGVTEMLSGEKWISLRISSKKCPSHLFLWLGSQGFDTSMNVSSSTKGDKSWRL
jgi:hypothetical protein